MRNWPVIGLGVDGFVIKQSNDCVLEVPKLYGTIDLDGHVTPNLDNKYEADSLATEKKLYRRIRIIDDVDHSNHFALYLLPAILF